MGVIKAIKKRLIDEGMTQAQLADALDTSYNNVRNIIYNGNPNLRSLEQMAEALGCDIALIDRETGEIYR